MEEWLVREENYKETMDNVVWPYLEARKEERSIAIEEASALSLSRFHADHPEKVVVISHGFTETTHKYAEIIYYFLKHNYEVYMAEHCGHGKSYRLLDDFSKVHIDSYHRYVRDLLKVASLAKKEMKGIPMTLYGHSMGGGIAGIAAGRKPEWFDRVILTSPMFQPLSGKIPWTVSKALACTCCLMGKEEDYIFGHGSYHGPERFENSCSLSRARFDYYQEYRYQEPTAQMSGATYGWARAAVQIHHELFHETYKKLNMPVLIVQAESDDLVSNAAHERFFRLLEKEHPGKAELICIPHSKHEIFGSADETVNLYWQKIFNCDI